MRLIVRLVAFALSRTPAPLAWAFAWAVSWLWWTLVPIRRALAAESMRRALPEVPVGPTLRAMMRGLAMGYFELFRELHRPGTVRISTRAPPPWRTSWSACAPATAWA